MPSALNNFINEFGMFAHGPNGYEKLKKLIIDSGIKGRLTNSHMTEGFTKNKVSDVYSFEYGKNLPKKSRSETGEYPVYGSNGVVGTHKESLINEKCIVVGRKGSAGALNICDTTGCWVTDVAYYVIPPVSMDLKYTYYLLLTLQLGELGKGIKPGLSRNEAYALEIAYPNIEEQKRIVAKIDELIALCDQLEAQQQQQANTLLKANTAAIQALLLPENSRVDLKNNWQRLADNFHTLYGNTLPMPPGEGRQKKHLVGFENIGKLRQSILNLAIQGKLVPQCADDESAEAILNDLRQKHASKKKGKRAIITDDVIQHPFELPKGWVWARFPELGEWGRGKSKHRPRNDPALFNDGKWPLIQTGDVANSQGLITKYSKKYSDFGLEQSKLWPKGTLCITIAANIADSAFLGIDACFPDSVVGLVPDEIFEGGKYFEYFIRTAKINLTDYAPSTAQKNINLGILEQVNIPMPPLEEQKRIVSKVDELMGLCDNLELQLTASYDQAEKLISATTKTLLA